MADNYAHCFVEIRNLYNVCVQKAYGFLSLLNIRVNLKAVNKTRLYLNNVSQLIFLIL